MIDKTIIDKKIENLIYRINSLITISETMPDDSGKYNLFIYASDDTLSLTDQKTVIDSAVAYFKSVHINYSNQKYYISIHNENEKDYYLYMEWQ